MVESGGSERLTAFVSMVVAVAILAAGVTAHQSSKVTDVNQWESDLRFQFEKAFRHDTRQGEKRLAQLDQVMADWRGSTQSDDDRQLLLAWFQEAGARSLPGTLAPLPERPQFSRVQPPTEHQVQKVPVPAGAGETSAAELGNSRKSRPKSLTAGSGAPITPTPVDPLEEEIVALRQPQTVALDLPPQSAARKFEVAPRPNMREPKLIEEDWLASVPSESTKETTRVAEPVGVNLTELAARIAGYHDALDDVETALLRMETASLDVVSAQINHLDTMTRDYGFLRLYYESLNDVERQAVLAPRSMKAALAEVERQLARCEEVLDGDFLGSFDSAAKEEFAALRMKLAVIGERVER